MFIQSPTIHPMTVKNQRTHYKACPLIVLSQVGLHIVDALAYCMETCNSLTYPVVVLDVQKKHLP